MRQLQVGLIGYGYAGRTFHAPIITAVPGLNLAKVVQRSGVSTKERYPSIEVVDHVDKLYQDPTIDLVVVTTPSLDHYTFVRDALLAGKHVVVEKPFTTTAREAEDLIQLADRQGLVLSVYHNRRWDGDFRTVRQLVEQGVLGRLTDVHLHWSKYNPTANPGRWRETTALGAGVFYDLGVHLFDQALTLFGPPSTISADIRTVRTGAVADDSFDVALGYVDGLRVRVSCTLVAREAGPRYVLHGSGGSYVKYGEDPQEGALRSGATPGPTWGVEAESQWGTLSTTIGGLSVVGRVQTLPGDYRGYYQNVSEAIHGLADLAVKPEQAKLAIRLIELGRQSSREQRTVQVEEGAL